MSARPTSGRNGSGLTRAAVDENAAVRLNGLYEAGDRHRSGDRGREGAGAERGFAAAGEIRRDGREGNLQLLETVRHGLGPEQIEKNLAVDQDGIRAAEQIGEAADTGSQKTRHHVGPVAHDAEYVGANLLAGEARRIGGPDDGPHGGAGDFAGRQAEVVEGLEHRHMGETPRPRPRRARELCWEMSWGLHSAGRGAPTGPTAKTLSVYINGPAWRMSRDRTPFFEALLDVHPSRGILPVYNKGRRAMTSRQDLPAGQMLADPDRPSFPLNAWYAAAWDVDVKHALLARKICKPQCRHVPPARRRRGGARRRLLAPSRAAVARAAGRRRSGLRLSRARV